MFAQDHATEAADLPLGEAPFPIRRRGLIPRSKTTMWLVSCSTVFVPETLGESERISHSV